MNIFLQYFGQDQLYLRNIAPVFKIEKSIRGEYEVTDAISLLAKDKKVKIKKN